jgi:hypothetical protein
MNHDRDAPHLTKTRAGAADMGIYFHADPGNHLRSREDHLEGHARHLPLPHDSMQTLGPLGITRRSREDHVTSREDMQNHLRSREDHLEGHACHLPLAHDSMQTLGPLGVTGRSRHDHVTSREDMQTIFFMIRWHNIPCTFSGPLGTCMKITRRLVQITRRLANNY